jgi:hypothetical protein
MKKGLMIVGILMISILSVSFVSANWFTDLFNLGEDSELGGELASLIDGCEDSDGGKAYLNKGTVEAGGESQTDYCIDPSNLMEYYCEVDGSIGSKPHNGHCEDGASIVESSNGILIEENIGDLVFSDIGYDDDCNFISGLIECDLWIGIYDYPLGGVGDINTVVMRQHENFTNEMFIDGVGSHFNSNLYNINERNIGGNNIYVISIELPDTQRGDFLIWYVDKTIIQISIINWDTSKVSDDILDVLFESYINKYSSDLLFGNFPEPGCTDMDFGKDYYSKNSCTDSSGGEMGDGCVVGGTHDGWLREVYCSENEFSVCTWTDYQCPFGCEDGVCIEGQGEFCQDTDGGLNFNEAGNCVTNIHGSTVSYGDGCGVTVNDVKYPNILIEWYCNDAGACVRDETPETYGHNCEADGKVCLDGACVTPKTCTDSDGGKIYSVKGQTSAPFYYPDKIWGVQVVDDVCIDSFYLQEQTCNENGDHEPISYKCPGACEDGACVCSDSDGGKNYEEKGLVIARAGDEQAWDVCKDEFVLLELTCDEQGGKAYEYTCLNGCEDGACIKGDETCQEAGYKCTSQLRGCGHYDDKDYECSSHTICCEEIPYCGDGVCFDVDYGGENKTSCPQDCGIVLEDDMDTCLETSTNYWDQQTEKCYEGYSEDIIPNLCSDPDGGKKIFEQAHTFGFRSSSTAEDPEKDLRIRTGGKDSCISETKLRENYCTEEGYISSYIEECVFGCEEGRCKGRKKVIEIDEGEKPEKLPDNDEDEQIIYVCGGCFNEDNQKCYPIGYRKKTSYCVDDGTFEEYLQPTGECLNNFECKSNLCIDTICVKPGVFKRFAEWFKLRFRER